MPVTPKIPKTATALQLCGLCNQSKPLVIFCKTKSPFFPNGHSSLCNECIARLISKNAADWSFLDSVCRWLDIPWVVKEWERLSQQNDVETAWNLYSNIFTNENYESINWHYYHDQYLNLQNLGLIEEEIPLLKEDKYKNLQIKWGSNYSNEELQYLENLYLGMQSCQNINGALQTDQAYKICKFSLEIDSCIRAGGKDIDKLLSAYDRLVKIGEFTPKNIKNAADFDSLSELGLWLEKRGFQNQFYDGKERDLIDKTLHNMERYNQRLYINEAGVGDEITERIDALKFAASDDGEASDKYAAIYNPDDDNFNAMYEFDDEGDFDINAAE